MLCLREYNNSVTLWPTAEDAAEAAEILPCSKSCLGHHTTVTNYGGQLRTRTVTVGETADEKRRREKRERAARTKTEENDDD